MEKKSQNRCCIVGKFESFHRGHQFLIEKAKELCSQVSVISINKFSQNPLFTPEERNKIAENLGVKLINLKFEEIKDKTPEEFFQILRNLGCSKLLAGKDWKFGKNRSGNIETAKKLGEKYNVEVLEVPLITNSGEKIGTSTIKALLKEGKLEEANKLLGFPYFCFGRTVKGDGRGKELGFPTINVKPEKRLLIPYGVYAVNLKVNGKYYRGIANYGVKPTFGENEPIIEVHIPNEKIPSLPLHTPATVEFLKFFRREKRFNNVEELKKQIKFDLENLKQFWRNSLGRDTEI